MDSKVSKRKGKKKLIGLPIIPRNNVMPVEAEDIVEALRRLSERITTTVAAAKSEGLLRPTEDNYSRYVVTNGAVRETEYGIERSSFELEDFTKESWFHAMRIVSWRAKDSEEYAAAADLLSQSSLSHDRPTILLDRFNQRIAYKFSETDDESQRQEFLNKLFSVIRKHLNTELVEFSTVVRLTGVVAPPKAVQFDAAGTEVYLRRVAIDDLVDEQPDFIRGEQFPRDPSAILQLRLLGEYGNVIQRKVWQAITILRLFKVGSIRALTYTNESESFFAIGGTLTSHDHHSLYTQAIIKDSDAARLEEFWKRMVEVLPEEGYEHKQEQVNPIEIAYQRYSDSLLTWGATVERRISDAVMGLESLFLTRDENQELAYRLRTRIAKTFGLLGYDPYSFKKAANDAYIVRSAFVHGDRVKDEDSKRIIKRHEGFGGLLNSILDQLRIAIVILSISKLTKEDLIKLLDDSFIDHNVLPKLEAVLSPVRKLVISEEEKPFLEAALPASE